jgi:hypothetical protein
MRIRNLLFALTTFGLISFSSPVFAGEPYGRLAPYWRTPTPYYVGNPKVIEPRKAPSRIAQNIRQPSPGPYAYPYGHFGAQMRPYAARSFGYYNDYYQTSYGFGY